MPNFSGLNPPTITQKYPGSANGGRVWGFNRPLQGRAVSQDQARQHQAQRRTLRGRLPAQGRRPRLWRCQTLGRQRALRLHSRFSRPRFHNYDSHSNGSHGPDSHNNDSHNNDSHGHAVRRRLWRVQLKCTEVVRARGYDVQPIYSIYGQGKMVYTAEDIDVLVAHIIPLDIWYVLPIEAFAPCKSLRFYPQGGCKRPRFEHYREAWHLLRSDHQQ